MSLRTVAVDHDGVIHAYRRGWHDGTCYDDPVPGAFDALRLLLERYAVFIHTARDPEQVFDWFQRHDHTGIPLTFGNDEYYEFWNGPEVLITQRKLPAVAYIDDRGIRFTSWPQALDDLAAIEERS